jgi:hypothetical protein
MCLGSEPRKVMYVIGNWSKFVRPGWHCLGTDGSTFDVPVTAFRKRETGRFAIVALNTTASPQELWIKLSGANSQQVVHWETSAGRNLEKVGDIEVLEGCFHRTLAAMSANTFVGNGPAESGLFRKTDALPVLQNEAENLFSKPIFVKGRIIILPSQFDHKRLEISIFSATGARIKKEILSAERKFSLVEIPDTGAGVNIIEISDGEKVTCAAVINIGHE